MVQVLFPNSYATDLGNGQFDMDADDFYMLLVDNLYTFNRDTHAKRSDVEGNEISGTGYTAGGQQLQSETWVQDNANDRTIFDFANPAWTNATFSADGAWVYKNRGGASTLDELVYFIDFQGTQSVAGATFEVDLDAIGAFVIRQL